MGYEQRVKLGFKFIAPVYDYFDVAFRLDRTRNPRLALARRIPNEPMRILDVCTGTGASALLAAAQNPLNRILGVDISPDMLAVATRKALRKGITNLELHEMDATSMSFSDGEFDLAMVSFGLHEMPFKAMTNALREMARVVKRGGSLYVVDYEREGGAIRRAALNCFLWLIEPPHVFEFLRYDWRSLLSDAGWTLAGTEVCFCSKMIWARRA